MPFDALRTDDDPGIPHAERLALSIDTPRTRRRQRWRTIGRYAADALGWALVAVNAVVWSAILWLAMGAP